MDLARAFMWVRPDAKFKGNSVNFFNLEIANSHLIGSNKVTQAEIDQAEIEIQTYDAAHPELTVEDKIALIDNSTNISDLKEAFKVIMFGG